MTSSNMRLKMTKSPTVRLFLSVLFSFGLISNVHATTNSLVLQQSPTVILGQSATYICAASGTGPDPTFIWTIRTSSNVIDQTMTSQATVPEVDTSSSDGEAKSQLQFIVTSSILNKQIWCGAVDSGRTSPTIEIFANVAETGVTVANLGETCGGTIQCGSFAFCNSVTQVCECNNGYYDDNGSSASGSCQIQNTLGNSCPSSIPSACAASNSVCANNICSCNTGYVQSGIFCIVDNTAGLGDSCTNPSRTCVIGNSVCTNGACQCNAGYYQSGSTCTQQSRVGETCNSVFSSVACSTTGSVCDSSTNRCLCPSGYVYSSTDNACNTPYVGQACTVTVGCRSTSSGVTGTTTSTCISNVCQCPSTYFSYNNICYIKSSVGSSCNLLVLDSCNDGNARCTGSGTTGSCTCNTGYAVNAQGTCTIISGTDYCTSASQNPSTATGTTSPSTPNVQVLKQCYETSLFDTVTLYCGDTKRTSAIRDAGWYILPGYTEIVRSTNRFINGDYSNPNLTISNVQSTDDGFYVCYLCYGFDKTDCTNSTPVELQVNGTAISSVVTTVSSTTPIAGTTVQFTCDTVPSNVATSYEWLRNGVSISSLSTFTITSITALDSGTYVCVAGNEFGNQVSSNQQVIDVQYAPSFTLPGGGDTINVFGDLDVSPITITCSMSANPAITRYNFYDPLNRLLATGTSNQLQITSSLGYGSYKCDAANSIGTSNNLTFNVQIQQAAPSTGASTENDGLATGTIVAIVIGIIFLILLIIIIIICCCTYGWCRKKENVQIEPVIVEQPKVKPYIPRSTMSASSSTVTRQDVGVVVNGHANVASEVPEEEPRYASPRYYLRPAKDAGPIISMYDNNYETPRAHQLPALDTQYLYTDEEPKKRHKKRRKKHRRSYKEEDTPAPQPAPVYDDEDLVVIPGNHNQNYYD